VETGRGRETYKLENCVLNTVNFLLKSGLFVVNDMEMRVAHPCVDKLLVEFNRLLDVLISCFVISLSVELLSSIS
jgi:hypothetical protein